VLLAPLRGVAYAWERVRRLTGRHRGADARLLAITGGFRFIARKPPGAGAPEAAG
jgi:hypothetical protein